MAITGLKEKPLILPIFKIGQPFQHFVKKVITGGFLLFTAAHIALLWANVASESYHHLWNTKLALGLGPYVLSKSLHHWVGEALMALFFLTVGLEIKREILIGELSSVKKAVLPVAAAIGGMVVPALIYLIFNGSSETAIGWGIPMATDIAFALAVLSLLGKRIPFGLKIFLSALAIADDLGAVLVIALFYTKTISWSYMGLSVIFLALLILANIFWIRNILVYSILGVGLWFTILGSGIHATVAGVLMAMCIPARGRYATDTFIQEVSTYLDGFGCATGKCGGHTIMLNQSHLSAVQAIEIACHRTASPLQRLEHALNGWVAYLILPLFALANSGVKIDGTALGEALTHPVSLGIMLALFLGKPLGISLFSYIFAKLLKIPLTAGVTWLHIIGASMLAGIGFTMSIFISDLSFSSAHLSELAKIGIIGGSMLSSIFGFGLLLFVSRNNS